MSFPAPGGHQRVEIRILALEGPEVDPVELCARVRAICRDGPGEVVCDATALTAPTLGAVNAVARAALTARRLGVPFRVRASPALHALLDLVGLGQPLREPEQREPPGRVQEGVEPDDPAVG
ncbi:hypothetical protein DEJ50_20230 [Streptomyces venezuelae]|uniref:Uncharacterized protein n=1 Tax=Streptomyces venezuelae TaxID=54571 RepID=A0A5P2DE98_STRVZ|nr:hypothetical protein DEJ50_20230 [Streptomyces venezuelae]